MAPTSDPAGVNEQPLSVVEDEEPSEVPHFFSELLRRRRPGMPVLFVTGGGAAGVPLDYPLIGMLRHPVRVTDVCDMLDQLIGHAALGRNDRSPPTLELSRGTARW